VCAIPQRPRRQRFIGDFHPGAKNSTSGAYTGVLRDNGEPPKSHPTNIFTTANLKNGSNKNGNYSYFFAFLGISDIL
jgi:hypothetical protein